MALITRIGGHRMGAPARSARRRARLCRRDRRSLRARCVTLDDTAGVRPRRAVLGRRRAGMAVARRQDGAPRRAHRRRVRRARAGRARHGGARARPRRSSFSRSRGSRTPAPISPAALGPASSRPAISPGKTWEGAAGGLIGAAAYAMILSLFSQERRHPGWRLFRRGSAARHGEHRRRPVRIRGQAPGRGQGQRQRCCPATAACSTASTAPTAILPVGAALVLPKGPA